MCPALSADAAVAAACRAAGGGVNVNAPVLALMLTAPLAVVAGAVYSRASLSGSLALTVPVTTPVVEFGGRSGETGSGRRPVRAMDTVTALVTVPRCAHPRP